MAKTRQKIITLQQTWSEKEQELQEEKLQLSTHLATMKAKNERNTVKIPGRLMLNPRKSM